MVGIAPVGVGALHKQLLTVTTYECTLSREGETGHIGN